MKQNRVVIGVGVVVVLMFGYLIYNQNSLQRENNILKTMQLQNSRRGGKDGKQEDLYIAGPVKNRIIKGYSEIKGCYTSYLVKNPQITDAKISVDWQIDTDGDAINPQVVYNQFNNKLFGKCIVEKIAKWKFPKPLIIKYKNHIFTFKDVNKNPATK